MVLLGLIGFGNIARTLVVSDGTVKTHVAHVLSKLGVRDRLGGGRHRQLGEYVITRCITYRSGGGCGGVAPSSGSS